MATRRPAATPWIRPSPAASASRARARARCAPPGRAAAWPSSSRPDWAAASGSWPTSGWTRCGSRWARPPAARLPIPACEPGVRPHAGYLNDCVTAFLRPRQGWLQPLPINPNTAGTAFCVRKNCPVVSRRPLTCGPPRREQRRRNPVESSAGGSPCRTLRSARPCERGGRTGCWCTCTPRGTREISTPGSW